MAESHILPDEKRCAWEDGGRRCVRPHHYSHGTTNYDHAFDFPHPWMRDDAAFLVAQNPNALLATATTDER